MSITYSVKSRKFNLNLHVNGKQNNFIELNSKQIYFLSVFEIPFLVSGIELSLLFGHRM